MEDLYTVEEVVAKLKVSEQAVIDWLRAGQLRVSEPGRPGASRKAIWRPSCQAHSGTPKSSV
jgi:hypothetical protein